MVLFSLKLFPTASKPLKNTPVSWAAEGQDANFKFMALCLGKLAKPLIMVLIWGSFTPKLQNPNDIAT